MKDFEENVNKQNNISKSRRKHIEENLNDLEENINKQSSILDRNTKNFIKRLNRVNEKLMRRKKSDMTNKSIFNYQNFKLTTENFPRWYRALKRHLTALDLIDCIKNDIDITEMDDDEIKEDCATQTIIESSLDSTTAELIEGCETAYEMIIRLESYFLQVGPSKLYQIEYQIKKLEVENDDIKLYIDKLNFLFQLHNKESKRCEKTKLDEDTKI